MQPCVLSSSMLIDHNSAFEFMNQCQLLEKVRLAELETSGLLALEAAERAELRDTRGLSTSGELCTRYTNEIWKLNRDTEEREAQLVQLLVRSIISMLIAFKRSVVPPTDSITHTYLFSTFPVCVVPTGI